MNLKIKHLLWLGALAAPILFGQIILFASLQPDYSYIMNSVSQLGATTSKHYVFMNLFGFIGTGVLITLGSIGAYLATKKLNINHLFSLAIGAFGLMFMGVAFPMDSHFNIHLFFANKMLIPLYISMLLLALFIWSWKINIFYKFLVYLLIFSMFIIQINDVSNQYIALLQKIKIVVIFFMYSVVFFSLTSWLKKA